MAQETSPRKPSAESPATDEKQTNAPARPFPVDNAKKHELEQNGQAVVMPEQTAAELEEEHEILHASIRAASVGQIVVATVAVIGLLYFAKPVLITVCTSLLIAFMLEPIVDGLKRLKVPRSVGALVAVLVLVGVVGALMYFFYNRAVEFSKELPKYSAEIRATVGKITAKTQRIEESTSNVLQPTQRPAVPVEVRQTPGVLHLLAGGAGVFGDVLLGMSFVPFLIYFMLSWQDHAHRATVQLFPKEHRLLAHRTLSRIALMIRSFIVGNLVVGVVLSVVSALVFWQLGIKYPYFIGPISGFVSLVPYLGVVLAVLPPLASGIGVLHGTGLIIVVVTVFGLHLISMNVLYPKLVGKRLRLNPLAISLSLLFWSWIWGAMGLILAVPITGATKVICDHVDSLRPVGVWLGE